MDFTLGETQQAVAQLAAQVLTEADPWKELARAGLLDVSPPDGLGVLEVAVLLTEIGRRAPSMKALATLMTGALPLARWGRTALLPAVASGELILTAALREPSHPAPLPPVTVVTNGRITGRKIGVPYAEQSHLLLVPASFMIVSSSGHIAPKTAHDHDSCQLPSRAGTRSAPRTAGASSARRRADRNEQAPPANPLAARAAVTTVNA